MKTKQKPKQCWNNFDNVQCELLSFIEKHGISGTMPFQSDIARHGRHDLVGAINKHGGSRAVAKRLTLSMAYSAKPSGYWDNFTNLRRELIAFVEANGTPGVMPTGSELRKVGRSDLAHAIGMHGGPQEVAEQLGFGYAKKRRGYWDEFSIVKQELLAFIEHHGSPGIMPSQSELNKAGCADLVGAINRHGGFVSIANRLALSSPKKPDGYWDDFSNVRRELEEFIRERGATGVMPTQRELQQAGRSGLVTAITKHGGLKQVAERLNLALTYQKNPDGYWSDFSNLKREILAFIEAHGTPGVMPTATKLKNAGRHGDLAWAISKHGGVRAIAKRLNLQLSYTTKPHGHWKDFTTLEHALLEFVGNHGSQGIMPTQKELRADGHGDLAAAIQKHGGYQLLATKLGLKRLNTAKTAHYWDDFSNVRRELEEFIRERGTTGVMPAQSELKEAGCGDLVAALYKHGGFPAVADRLGLKMGYDRKHRGYWSTFSNVEQALFAFIQSHGTPGVMPMQRELREAGQTDLATAIEKHGGFLAVAELLGLKLRYTVKPTGYWDDFSNIEHELRQFIDRTYARAILRLSFCKVKTRLKQP